MLQQYIGWLYFRYSTKDRGEMRYRGAKQITSDVRRRELDWMR